MDKLKQKVGPLPVWGWGLGVMVVAAAYFYLHRSSATSADTSGVSGSDTGTTSTIPDYSQGYDSGYGAGLTTGLATVPSTPGTAPATPQPKPKPVGGNRTIYGYGLNHEPFYSRLAAEEHGRLGKGTPRRTLNDPNRPPLSGGNPPRRHPAVDSGVTPGYATV